MFNFGLHYYSLQLQSFKLQSKFKTHMQKFANFENKLENPRWQKKHLFGIDGDSEWWVNTGGDGGVSGVLTPVGDISDGVAVDADARDGAVDLESGLEIEDRAVDRETHYDQCWRRWRPNRGSLLLHGLRQGAAALGSLAGNIGSVPLATHGCVRGVESQKRIFLVPTLI